MASPRLIHVLTIAVLILLGFIGLSIVVRQFVIRPPFLIVLEPTAGTTVVQFIQPMGFDGRMSVSPMFKINKTISQPFQAALSSRHVTIPSAVIEHGDTTILPGDFRIRFGNDVFVVMSHRIVANGQDYNWLEQPATSEETIDVSQQPTAN